LDDHDYVHKKLDDISEGVGFIRGQLSEVIPAHAKRLDEHLALIEKLTGRVNSHEKKHARSEGFFAAGKLALVGAASSISLGAKYLIENWADIFSATK
jgi:hypothetical protein